MTVCRGVRGAVPVMSNTESDILAAAERLLSELIDRNGILSDDIASAFFTTSPDLNAEYPAVAARKLGWTNVALLCGLEMDVPHGMQRCLRILIHWNTDKSPEDIVHVYLDRTRSLRPDLYVEEQ